MITARSDCWIEKTPTAHNEVSADAAIASVMSEVESISLQKEKVTELATFFYGKDVFGFPPTGL